MNSSERRDERTKEEQALVTLSEALAAAVATASERARAEVAASAQFNGKGGRPREEKLPNIPFYSATFPTVYNFELYDPA